MNSNINNTVTIIGGGPAGLSAAIYSARANLSPVVYAGSPPGGQLMITSEVENYPGYSQILGPNLIEVFRKQAQKFNTEIINENITSVDFKKYPFTLTYSDKKINTNTVIITTGAKALWLNIESEQKYLGKGLSACATCDGFFFKDKIVAVVGGGDTAMEEAQTLTKFAKLVYIIHRRDSFRASQIMQARVKASPKIKIIWNNEVVEVLGENRVEAVKLKNEYEGNTKLLVDGVFVAIGHKPDTGLFKGQIELDEKGYIVTTVSKAMSTSKLLIDLISNKTSSSLNNPLDQLEQLEIRNYDLHYQSMTSVQGVFAAGDCVDHQYRQAGTAAGMGIAAALDAERWILEKE